MWFKSSTISFILLLIAGSSDASAGTVVEARVVGLLPGSCATARPCLEVGVEVIRQHDDERRGRSEICRLDDLFLVRGRQRYGEAGLRRVVAAVVTELRKRRRGATSERRAMLTQLIDRLRGGPHYSVRPEVVIAKATEQKVAELARAFYNKRRRRLLVTSGTRTPRSQAEAMYTKFAVGGRTRGLYRKWRAARAIERAYRRGRQRRRSRGQIIAAMTEVIAAQVKEGIFVSPHLQRGAVDIRSLGLRRRDRRILMRLARRFSWLRRIKLERRPPHFHLWIDDGSGGLSKDAP